MCSQIHPCSHIGPVDSVPKELFMVTEFDVAVLQLSVDKQEEQANFVHYLRTD